MKKCCPEDLPLISVIIVNWNGAKFLAKCLAALKAQTFKSFEIIIIDNGSNDRSVDNLETTWPEVRVERLKKNKGFAAANNLGARLAKGTWLALINYDAFPTPGWLQALSDASIKFSEFSFFASYLVMAERNNYTDGMGDIYNVCGMAWRRGHGKPMDIFKQKEIEVFGPCAAAEFYPR